MARGACLEVRDVSVQVGGGLGLLHGGGIEFGRAGYGEPGEALPLLAQRQAQDGLRRVRRACPLIPPWGVADRGRRGVEPHNAQGDLDAHPGAHGRWRTPAVLLHVKGHHKTTSQKFLCDDDDVFVIPEAMMNGAIVGFHTQENLWD